jgi:hypothetical protein
VISAIAIQRKRGKANSLEEIRNQIHFQLQSAGEP